MNISEKVYEKVCNMKPGTIFKYHHLNFSKDKYLAITKAMERLIRKGIVKRISSGNFYIPKSSIFGEFEPSAEQLILPYLYDKNGVQIGYITGNSIYHKMGLTTEVPKVIQIASAGKLISIAIGNIKATGVKSYVEITEQNYYLLQLLDALKDFKIIPNLNIKLALDILLDKISHLKDEEIDELLEYVVFYPSRAVALFGALVEKTDASRDLTLLKKYLNRLSKYEIGIDDKLLSTASNWGLK